MKAGKLFGWKTGKNLRAFVDIPEIDTLKGIGANDIRAGLVGGATLLQIACHGGLTPLGAVHGRWQGQMLALQAARESERESTISYCCAVKYAIKI